MECSIDDADIRIGAIDRRFNISQSSVIAYISISLISMTLVEIFEQSGSVPECTVSSTQEAAAEPHVANTIPQLFSSSQLVFRFRFYRVVSSAKRTTKNASMPSDPGSVNSSP